MGLIFTRFGEYSLTKEDEEWLAKILEEKGIKRIVQKEVKVYYDENDELVLEKK
jgi:hypothetical protein